MSDFTAKIIAQLDTSKIPSQIAQIGKKGIDLSNVRIKNAQMDTKGLAAQVQAALNKQSFSINLGKVNIGGITNNAAKSISQSLNSRIYSQLNTGQIEASIAKVTAQYEKLSTTGHTKLTQIQSDIERLNVLNSKMATTSSTEHLNKSYTEFNTLLSRVKNNLTSVSAESKMMASSLQVKTLDNKMSVWMQNNSKATKDFGASIDTLRSKLKSMSASGTLTTTQLKGIENEFKSVTIAAQQAGKLGKTFGDTFKSSFSSITKYVSASTLIFSAVNTLRQGATTVKELDSALIDLQKTAQATASQLTDFYFQANDVAKEYGATTQEIIQSAADWSRLGYSLNDSKLMAQYSSMFKSISPGMDIDTATTGLVSVMKAYGIEAEDVLDGVMSKINKIGNTAATSNDQIIEGLQQSSAAMATMGSSLDENIALFTAAQEITQDASKVGNALRSISMRIRGYNEETEELDDSLVNITGDVIDLTKTASNPNGVSLFTDETQTEYKSIYTYLQDISKIYDELGAKEQQQLLEKLFGKNRASVGAALLDNFSAAEKAMSDMSNSAGSAEAEMSTITKSLEYKLNALKETCTGIFQNLFKKEDMSAIISGLTSILEVVDTITEKLGLFGTIGVGVGLTAFIKNLNQLKGFGTLALDLGGLKNAKEIFAVAHSLKSFTTESIAARIATTSLSNEQKIAAIQNTILAATGKTVTAAEAEEALAAAAAATSTGAAGAAATGASVGFAAFGASVKAAAAGLATFLLSNPVGWAILAAGAIFGVVKTVDALTESFEEAQEKAAESRDAYQTTTSEIEQLNSELETTKSRIAEIKAQGALSVTDKAELAELQAQNEQLERQKEIKEKIANVQGQKAAEDANNVLTKKTQSATEWIDDQFDQDWNTSNDARDIIERTKEKQQSLNQYTADYNKLLEEQSKLKPEYSSWWEADTQYEKNEKQLESYKNQMDTLSSEIAENLDEINTEYTTLFDSDGNVLSGFEDTAQRCEELFDYTLSSTDKAAQTSEKIDAIFNKPTLSNFKDELLKIAENSDNVGITADDVKNKYSELAHACKDAGVDIQDLVDYINSTAGIINVDEVKSQLSEAFDVSGEKDNFDKFLDSLSVDELKVLYSIYESNDTSGWNIEDFQSAMDDLQNEEVTVHVDVDMENSQGIVSEIQSLQSALDSQSTGKSISLETFNSDELADYRSALEYVNGAMQLNAEKVRDIVKAKADEQIAYNNTQKAIEQSKYLENAAEIERLRTQIKEKNYAEGESEEIIQNNIDALLAENSTLKQTCDTYNLMNSSITEATSAYQNWLNAQNASQSGEMFDGALDALKKINDTLNVKDSDSYGRIGNEDYKAAIDFVIPESVDSDDQDAVNNYLKSVKSMFTLDNDGNYTGLDIAAFCEQAVQKGLMVIDEKSDEYKVAGQTTMQDFADGLNLSLPLVQAMFGEMEEFGADFDWADEADKSIGDLAVTATESAEALRSMKKFSDLDIKLNVEDMTDKQAAIDTLDATIKEMNGVKAKVDVDSSQAEHANNIIRYCVEQKQMLNDPVIMSVDTSMVGEKIGNAISLLQELQTAANNLEMNKTLGIDTSEAQAQVDSLVEKVQSADNSNIMSKLNVDTSDYDSIMNSLQTSVTGEVLIKCGVDDKAIIGFQEAEHNSKGTVTWDNDTKAIDTYMHSEKLSSGKVQWYNDESLVKKTFTASGTINWTNSGGTQKVNGSAHASGTAKAGGDWRTPTGGQTLVGELGQEIVVDPHTGKWYTVGDNGAEFRDIPKGSIVFNHLQSKALLENGYVSGRATALVSGSAMVTGGIKRPQAAKPAASQNKKNKDDKKSSSSSKKDSKSKSDKKEDKKEDKALERFKKWFSKLFDWIEIKLERQTKKIERYTTKASNASDAGNYDTAAKNYRNAISSTATQISYEKTAESKYSKQGDKVLKKAVKSGIVSQKTANGIKKKVQNGTMDIKKYSERMQEVIKDYQTWYDKSQDAKDAITELHNNIRTYIADLKDLRDAQRDAKLDSIDTFTSIGTSGVANSTRAKNSQLKYTNSQIAQQNKAYDTEVSKVSSDTNAIGKKGKKSVKKALKSKNAKKDKKYKKALKNAQKAIKAKKPVASADLKVIKSKSISVYNNLYAYNLALDNVETAKLEQAANYAANSAETYKNIAESYENKDNATNDKISLLKQKSSNAKSAKAKNDYLAKAAGQYDTILANDDKEIAEYNKAVNSNKKTVTKKAGTTSKYKKLNSKTKKAVMKVIKSAKAAVKSKKPIPAATISSLAKYYSKGYVTKAFYEACVSYNDALESLDLAKEQKKLDVQDAIAEKAAIGTEMVNNVEQEYTNKLNDNANKTQQIQTAQSVKTTRGLSLTSSDYQNLIAQSQADQALYSGAASAISAQIQSNLANGYWTTDSQEYKDAIQTMNDYSNRAEECRVEQEEWNNAIADIPYSTLEKVLDLLDAVKENYESMLSIRDAMGITETESEYLVEIANANAQIAKYTELRTQAWEDYQKALANSDGVYGGKTADEWLAEYYNYDTSINNLKTDVVELNNEIANIPYQTIEKVLDLLKSVQSYNNSSIDLKSALGLDLSEADYMQQIKDNNDQIEQYSKERLQAYSDYLKALSNPDGVYGGKTSNEWLAEYNEYGTTINDLYADNEKLKDSLRDDVYWRTFERAHDAAKRFQNVLSGLSDLIDSDMYFDDDGNLSEYGVAQVANLVSEYENARKEVQNYQADIANLNKLYSQGYYTEQEYVEKLNELQVGLLDSASSMKQFSDSIVEMYKNMAQSELDALMDLIDARNDALSAKKAYYDYDKTIKDRTKDIQTLEAEIAALQGVETAEAKAKRAMYEAQLAESKEELDNTIQEHMFDLSQDALNELKTTLQDAFDDKWENINSNLTELTSLMAAANQLTASSAGTIVSTMNKLLGHYGIDPVSSGIQAAYASGTRRVPKELTALTNEKGNEILVTKKGMITPLEQGDGVVPSYLTNRLYDLALNGVPTPNTTVPEINISMKQPDANKTEIHIDKIENTVEVEGNADASTVKQLKELSDDIVEKSYKYTSEKIYRGYMHSGGKRNV